MVIHLFYPFKFNYEIIVAVFWGESEEGNVTLLNGFLKKYPDPLYNTLD